MLFGLYLTDEVGKVDGHSANLSRIKPFQFSFALFRSLPSRQHFKVLQPGRSSSGGHYFPVPVFNESRTEVVSLSDIEIPVVQLQDVNEELINSLIAIFPCVRMLQAVEAIWGGNCGRGLRPVNRTPVMAIQAERILCHLERVALGAPVDESIFPVLIVLSAKEVAVFDGLITLPVPAGIGASCCRHGP